MELGEEGLGRSGGCQQFAANLLSGGFVEARVCRWSNHCSPPKWQGDVSIVPLLSKREVGVSGLGWRSGSEGNVGLEKSAV